MARAVRDAFMGDEDTAVSVICCQRERAETDAHGTQDRAAVCVEHTHASFAVVRHEDTPDALIDCYRTGG